MKYNKSGICAGPARFLHGEEPGPPSLPYTYTDYRYVYMCYIAEDAHVLTSRQVAGPEV